MDLAAIKPTTIKLNVNHPGTGMPTGLIFELRSLESDAVKRVHRSHMDKALRRRSNKITAEEIEGRQTETLVAAIVGWEWKGDAAWQGKKLEFSSENVAMVIGVDWVRLQIDEALKDEAAFFTN